MKPDEPLAERLGLAHSHLRGSCPVLLQISVLLATLLNGAPLQHGASRSGSFAANAGDVCGAGTNVQGHDPATPAQPAPRQDAAPSCAKQPRTSRHGRSGHGRASFSSRAAPTDHLGSVSDPARPGDSKPATHGPIHAFFEPRTQGRLAPIAGGVQTMEATTGDCIHIPDDSAETTTGADPCQATQKPGRTDCGEQGHRPDFHHFGAERGGSAGPQLSLSPMGSSDTTTGAGQKDTNFVQDDVPVAGGALRDAVGQGACDQIPCLATAGCPEEDRGMEAPNQHAERQGTRDSLQIGLQRAVDGAGCLDEASHSASDAHGHDDSIKL